MRYLAMLELFGIARSEVSFSLADLLAYGYGAMINVMFSNRPAQMVFGGLIGAIAITGVLLLWDKGAVWKQMLLSWLVGAAIDFLPVVPMLVGYYPAKASLLTLAADHLKVDPGQIEGLAKRTEVLTSDGWIRGDVLLSTNEFTYLLSDALVYKIRQLDGKIVRKTQLTARLKEISSSDGT